MNKLITLLSFQILFFSTLFSQITIEEARQMPLGSTVEVQGIITHGPEMGPIRYLQDATGGIPIYAPGNFSDEALEGHEIKLSGELKDFRNLLEIDPLSAYEIISTGNTLPAFQVITPAGMSEDTEAELVKIDGVTFEEGGNKFGVGTYFFNADGERGQTYIRSGHPLVGTNIPLASVNISGIVSQFEANYQLLLRGERDLQIADAFFIAENPAQSNIGKNSFDVSWETNVEGTTLLRYGTTTDMDQQVMVAGVNTDHKVTLSGLEPATFYYVQGVSEKDGVEILSSVKYFSTVSNSSGEIQVYFNKSVDPSYSTGGVALTTTAAALEAAIIKKIDDAQSTIDVSMYNNNRRPLRNALERAFDRGVIVRYIANNGTLNAALSNPNTNFPVLQANPDALMHNKYLAIDVDSELDSWVLMGSLNFTEQNEINDYNNMVFIQDQALAKAYVVEFEEMWGASTPTPGIFTVKSGVQKSDNTPHQFIINGQAVESYFSPSDNTTLAIVDAVKSADETLDFALLTFTVNDLGTAVLNAHNDGIEVRGIVENTTDQGTEFAFLESRGVNIVNHPAMGSIHHKYGIIDGNAVSSDPIVVTGSHNWSASAETRNDENTLLIHSPVVANIFIQEFEQRWCEIQGNSNCFSGIFEDGFKPLEMEVSPNPILDKGTLAIKGNKVTGNLTISIFSANGQLLSSKILPFQNSIPLDLSGYPSGIYYIKAQSVDYQGVLKIVKQ